MKIYSRAETGLRNPKSRSGWARKVGQVVHWIGSDFTNGNLSASMASVRSIQSQHMDRVQKKPSDPVPLVDIAYNFLIDHLGNIFEGRGWDARSGAHSPYNDTHLAICFLVDKDEDITQAQWDAFVWLSTEAKNRGFNELLAHHETSSTSCPGDKITARINNYRNGVPVSADKLTKEEVIELHVAFHDGPPGPNYDWRHVGGPLSAAIAAFKPGTRGRLTKAQVEKLHKAILGGAPGANYDWRHVDNKLQLLLDDWVDLSIALANRIDSKVAGKDTKLVEAGTGGFDKEQLYVDQIAATKKVFGK